MSEKKLTYYRFRLSHLITIANIVVTPAVIFSSQASFAQVPPALVTGVTKLTEAIKVNADCTATTKIIVGIKIPPGHDQAMKDLHHNDGIEKAHSEHPVLSQKMDDRAPDQGKRREARRVDPDHLKKIPPEMHQFFQQMSIARRELQRCGEAYVVAKKSAEAYIAALNEAGKTTSPDAMKKMAPNSPEAMNSRKIGEQMEAYTASTRDLHAAIVSLSSGDHQRYVSRVINKYFLERE